MIRTVVVPAYGDVDVLEVRSVPAPSLNPGTIRIQVAAAGVNFADLMMRMGLYPEAPPRPFVPGYEVAGTVAEVSTEAARSHPELTAGTRVLAVTRFGGYADEVVVPANHAFPLPEGWSLEEGAAFPVVFLTAWTALRAMARVRERDRVLVYGIAGGVGLAALQIALAAGARVIGTCGGPEKAQAAEKLGAERAVDYRTQDIAAAVREWAPGGVDIILDPRGGRAFRQSLSLAKPTGRVVTYGVSTMVSGRKKNLLAAARGVLPLLWLSPLRLIRDNLGVFGLNVLQLWDRDDLLADAWADLMEGAGRGTFRPVVDRSFPLERAAEAHRTLHDRKNIGKVVLTTGG